LSCFLNYDKSIFERLFQVGMSVIYILIAVSIVVAVIFFIAFIYAVKSGQYDDSYTPSVRMLFDDELKKNKTEKSILTNKNNTD